MTNVYINAMGTFLPGKPIGNDEAEEYLGKVNGELSVLKNKIGRAHV